MNVQIILLIAFGSVLLQSDFSNAETIFVPEDFEVLQDAVDAAEDGDSIIVAPGDYDRILIFRKNNLTLIGAGLEAEEPSVIHGDNREVALKLAECEGFELQGFELTTGYTAVWLHQSSAIWVHHNYIHDLPDGWSSSISVDGSSEVLIERNIMLRSWHYGVYINFGCNDIVVRNNVIGYMVNNDGIHLDDVNNADIYNNIIILNGDYGIYATQNAENMHVAYNDLYSNGHNFGGFQLDQSNIQANPLFVNPAQNDFHLREDSPCIDAGDPNSPPDPDGSRADIGCFFYGIPIDLRVSPESIDLGIIAQNERIVTGLEIAYFSEEEDAPDLGISLESSDEEWLSVEPQEAELAANDTLDFDVIIEVPDNFELGNHNGQISILVDEWELAVARVPVSMFVVEGFGSLTGIVVDPSDDQPVPGVQINLEGIPRQTMTDDQGRYEFDPLPAWTYTVGIDAEDYMPYRSEAFDVETGEDAVLNIELLYAACEPDPDRIHVGILPNTRREIEVALTNPGTGQLDFSIEKRFPQIGDAEPWDERGRINAGEQVEDDYLQGVEFDGDRFYVSGGNNGDDRSLIHVFSRDGQHIRSFDQFQESRWGMRDLAWDGTLSWGGDGSIIYGFTPDGELDRQFEAPVNSVRGMTWDPVDSLLWVGDISRHLYGVTRDGEVVREINLEDDVRIIGLGTYPDDPDGFTIYAFCNAGDFDTQVNKLNMETGEWVFVADLETTEDEKSGGMCITGMWDPMSWVYVGLIQGRDQTPDAIGIWHITTYSGWLTFEPDNGVIPPEESVELRVNLTSMGVPGGLVYQGELTVTHNGRGDGLMIIPVSMEVLGGGEVAERILSLRGGWNLVSLNVIPRNVDIPTLLAPLVDADLLALVKDDQGRFYHPGLGVNNIPFWSISEGYYVKVNDAVEFEISGLQVDPDSPIDLEQGWQSVAYFPQRSTDAVTGLSGIVDDLIIAKDGMGYFYVPRWNFSNIPAVREGQGYLIKMESPGELVWQLDEGYFGARPVVALHHFPVRTETGENMSLLIETTGIPAGAEIAALNSGGVIVGSGVVSESGRCGVALWGDDPSTEVVDGLLEGETPEFSVWLSSHKTEAVVIPIEGDLAYHTDNIAVGRLILGEPSIASEFTLGSPYPNPFNDVCRVSYSLPDAGFVTLELIDLTGRSVRMILNGWAGPGSHQMTVSASGLPSGVYLLKLASGDQRSFRKLVVMR